MKIVIKIGGKALEDKATLRSCAKAVAQLVEDGHKVAVVHGGGTALTRTLQRMGKKSEFIDGLRITDAETRDVAVMVLAGMVNKQLVASIAATGKIAIGLCGGDGAAFRAKKKITNGYNLGYVGEIAAGDPRWIEAAWLQNGIPVLSSIALAANGEYYNVNADEMASACAISCHANTLIFLTDVAGVKGTDGEVIPVLRIDEVNALIRASAISGGMLPKLEACGRALRGGVGRVRILPANKVEALTEFYFAKLDCGTEVLAA